ncbi:50S ribosomal protein L6 [soil metagenome]
MSRIGNKSIPLPEKVAIKTDGEKGKHVVVEGPKGKLEWTMPDSISLSQEDGNVTLKRASDERRIKALHGTARSLISNMITGVSQGFTRDLEIQGVGFRATLKGSALDLNLGYSHPVLHPVPDGLTVTVNENTKIRVEGIDKQLVGQFAADVRAYYPPEPYKGKGVRYAGEQVRRKAGKSVQK